MCYDNIYNLYLSMVGMHALRNASNSILFRTYPNILFGVIFLF